MTPLEPQPATPELDRHRFQFSLKELLVVTPIIAILLAMLLPLLNVSREADRSARCLNNAKEIGLAFQCYASTFNNTFPPSASLTKAADGSQTVGGWSHLVRLLSFMEYDSVYKQLNTKMDPEGTSNPVNVMAMNTQFSEFVCPSGPRRRASGAQQSAGITNYKAMGATTRGSLGMVVNPQATPPYGTMSSIPGTVPLHPDGAIFPGNGTRAADVLDGPGHTIFTIETIDEAASRWTVGKEATLVGLPQNSSPTGTTPQPPLPFFAPPGFDYTWGPDSAVTKAGLRTFLSYDFSPTGADIGKYEDPGFGPTPPAYGPSSGHPAVVICGMGDGSVKAISKQIDAAYLFFMITKNGSDPFFLER